MAEQEQEEIALPIEWYFPEDIISRYANNITVQHSENEFIISFFEVRSPMILGTPEEEKAKWEQIETVRAECVARVIVTTGKMSEFISALQRNLEKYRSRFEKSE